MDKYLETERFLNDFAAGLRTAFDALFNEYWSQLYLFGYKMTANSDKTREIAIQAFNDLYQSIEQFDCLDKIRTKLYTNVRDYSLNYIKYSLVLTEDQKKYLLLVENDPDLINAQLDGMYLAALYKKRNIKL